MLRRLLEADYFAEHEAVSPARVRFWLAELRTPELLVELLVKQPGLGAELTQTRPLLLHARTGDSGALQDALDAEAKREREADRRYGGRSKPNWNACATTSDPRPRHRAAHPLQHRGQVSQADEDAGVSQLFPCSGITP